MYQEIILPVPADVIKAEADHREFVFGLGRLELDSLNPVSDSDVQDLIDLVDDIAEAQSLPNLPDGLHMRYFPREKQAPLMLRSNQNGVRAFGFDELEAARVAVRDVSTETRFIRNPRLPIGRYALAESVYVDFDSHKPSVRRDINSIIQLGRAVSISASKPASATDIREAIDSIYDSLRSQSK
jgi:hypothetical protein